MSFNREPLVREAFEISLSSAPLQATEALLNRVRAIVLHLAPAGAQRDAILQNLSKCWLLCAMVFSVGKEHGRNGSMPTEAAEKSADFNQQAALDLVTALRTDIQRLLPNNADGGAADDLITTGELINTLYGAGRADGMQLRSGAAYKLQDGDKTC